jgi:16S rRNA (guanine527-N7)-methyltransferase
MDSINVIEKYFPGLSGKQREQFEKLGPLYADWNSKINVISRKDIDNLYTNHILHSLAIAKFLQPAPGTTFLDMGTGGGFPGIPLAIMYPECRFHLIDRIGKKIKVAQAIAEAIGLTNVTFQHGDIGECRQKYDYVVSRAVMRLDELLPLIKKNVGGKQRNGVPNGLICLKGGDISDELRAARADELVDELRNYFDEEYFATKKLVYVAMC